MAVKMNAQEYQEKHARRLKAAVPDIRRGVERVTESPMLKAAAKSEKMLQNLTEAVNDGKWERGLRRVSLEDWKNATVEKGTGRIAAGIDAAKEKTIAFAEELLPAVERAQTKINTMPDLTLEDNINRMGEYAREMSNFRRRGT